MNRDDLFCGMCDRQLVFLHLPYSGWCHMDDRTVLCDGAIPYVDRQVHILDEEATTELHASVTTELVDRLERTLSNHHEMNGRTRYSETVRDRYDTPVVEKLCSCGDWIVRSSFQRHIAASLATELEQVPWNKPSDPAW